jgi:hypothetical protein
MKLPTQKKILREDIKGAPSWAGPLVDTLNSFMETVYQAMNRNITLQQNVACFIKEITYKTPATYPSGVTNAQFLNELKTKALGLQVLQCVEKTTYLPAPGPVYVPWTEDNGNILVYPVTGLEADKTYIIRLLVY